MKRCSDVLTGEQLAVREVAVVVERNPVATSFAQWAKPGFFFKKIIKKGSKNDYLDLEFTC
jgi:hypothetical protein